MNDREAKQEVELIDCTCQPIRKMFLASRTCYSQDSPIDMWKNWNEKDLNWDNSEQAMDDMLTFLKKQIFTTGHHSVLEHCSFTFAISGVSRALTHQLVRHRHAVFSQKSQRYVTELEPFKYIVPETIIKAGMEEEYKETMFKIAKCYVHMLDKKIPAEDARYVFPNACETALVMTVNLRELMHIANLRTCSKAQWEIRNLVNEMCRQVIEKMPFTKELLVPNCVKDGKCKEAKPCRTF